MDATILAHTTVIREDQWEGEEENRQKKSKRERNRRRFNSEVFHRGQSTDGQRFRQGKEGGAKTKTRLP